LGLWVFGSFPSALATDRYISLSGLDSNPGTEASPWLTWQKFVSSGVGGDRVYFRAGTYTYQMDESFTGQIPSGTDLVAGATIVSAYPGETVIHKPQVGSGTFPVQIRFGSYIIFTNLTFDCTNGFYGAKVTDSGHHIRWVDCTIKNVPRSHGLLVSPGSGSVNKFVELIRCTLSNIAYNKQPTDNDLHGAYIRGGSNIVDGCTINGPDLMAWGIHFYTEGGFNPLGNICRNNLIQPVNEGGHDGILAASGDDGLIYNNRIIDAAIGLRIEAGCQRWLVANNTIYSTGTGIEVGGAGGTTDITLDNNLINATTDPWTADVHLYPGAAGTIVRNNLGLDYTNLGSGTTASDNLFGAQFDPQFISPPSNLRIGAASSALNAGRTETAFNVDFEGNSRPQGNAWDIGKDERVEAGSLPLVKISQASTFAYEENSVDGTVTINRDTGSGSLTVNFRITGTATNGTDYATISPTNVVFSIGETNKVLTINPTDDALVEGNETVIIDLWTDAAYNLGSPTNSVTTIIDNDPVPPPPPPPPPPPVGEGGPLPSPLRRADVRQEMDAALASVKTSVAEVRQDSMRNYNQLRWLMESNQTNTNAEIKALRELIVRNLAPPPSR
jgi:hypothetical protein